MQDKPKIIVVCGPTGSGKTGLAVELCKKFDGEIVNADSRQVYREMDIGTAKELDEISNDQFPISNQCPMNQFSIGGAPIYLVNILEPNEKYSVGQFKKDAEIAIADIISRGKIPFIVGGTGMYIDALVENFIFPSNAKIKNQKSKLQFKNKSLGDLLKTLEALDPEALKVVDLKNRRRVERAIEVCMTTGVPFTQQRKRGERNYEVLKLAPAVSLEREKLYEKINKRVNKMIEQGLEKEVQMLAEKYGWGSESMTGIGYREFKCEEDISKIIERIKIDTRQYAKRQMTWFKRDREIAWCDLREAEKLVKEFLFR